LVHGCPSKPLACWLAAMWADGEEDYSVEWLEGDSPGDSPGFQIDSEFLEDDFLDMETSDLGDMTDVPRQYLQEIVELLRSLPGPDDDPGNIASLRFWILSIKRLAGFSRVATIQLLTTIAQCLEANRPKGYKGGRALPSRDDMQQAFVRLNGVTESINVMLLRLNDANVVSQVARTLAAGVQNCPLAAEAMLDGPSAVGKVRLLMRALERHDSDFACATNACFLVAHLCSVTAQPGTTVAAPSRFCCQRRIQSQLASETGAIDLLINLLSTNVLQTKEDEENIQVLHKKATANTVNTLQTGVKRDHEKMTASVGRARQQIEMCHAWATLNATEATGARIQEMALQALLLLVFGNPDNTRKLAGEFWVWGRTRQAAQRAAEREEELEREMRANAPKKMNKAEKRKAELAEKRKAELAEHAEPDDAALEDDISPKSDLVTLEAFSTTSLLLLEVLTGRAARDRPELAGKASRLLAVIADHNLELLKHIEAGSNNQRAEMVVKLRPGPTPLDSCNPQDPFVSLKPMLSALLFAMQTHKTDVPLLAETMSLLVKMKKLAMLAAPPGVGTAGENLLYAWQHLLADVEQNGELEFSNKLLKQAGEDTDVANERMRVTGQTTDQLTGDSVWLTPRLREAVGHTTLAAAELIGDALAWRWRHGEPTRLARKNAVPLPVAETKKTSSRRSNATPGAPASESTSSTSKRKKTVYRAPDVARPSTLITGRLNEALKALSNTRLEETHTKTRREAGAVVAPAPATLKEKLKQQKQTKLQEKMKQKEELGRAGNKRSAVKDIHCEILDVMSELKHKESEKAEGEQWNYPVGYETLDQEDYDRFWSVPLNAAVTRSLEMPSVKQQRAEKMQRALEMQRSLEMQRDQRNLEGKRLTVHGPPSTLPGTPEEPCEQAEAETTPQIFSSVVSSIDIKFIQSSEPGLLKTKIILQPLDDNQGKASQLRMKQLMAGHADGIAQDVCKTFRKNGYLLPAYGIKVQFVKGSRLAHQDQLAALKGPAGGA